MSRNLQNLPGFNVQNYAHAKLLDDYPRPTEFLSHWIYNVDWSEGSTRLRGECPPFQPTVCLKLDTSCKFIDEEEEEEESEKNTVYSWHLTVGETHWIPFRALVPFVTSKLCENTYHALFLLRILFTCRRRQQFPPPSSNHKDGEEFTGYIV